MSVLINARGTSHGAFKVGDTGPVIGEDGSITATGTLNLVANKVQVNGDDISAALTNHIAAADPHTQYLTKAESTDSLAAKVDKVAGKQLSTEDFTSAEKSKLGGIAAGANNYTHPANHPASIITQDANNRFVTDAEKAAWNAKQAGLVSGTNIKTINGESLLGAGNIFVGDDKKVGTIGVAGELGFGVGEYPGTLPSGFNALMGTSLKGADTYGNYQYSDGSIMVFVPKFYYRIGSASSPNYAKYGANAIDIAGIGTFADEAAANTAGYALHRAFKDGGTVKSGFFIDKYLASKNGTGSCKSVQNGVPISLATTTGYTTSNGMTGCTGILADAVVLARARGAGRFNLASIFMYDALAKLSLAHGQAAIGTAACAWYNAAGTTNFPKGCNNSALADVNDATVTFTTAGDTGNTSKPKTGSASNLAKTTHNGQASGVADINGGIPQAMLGLTQAGTSATDTTQNKTGDAYLLKPSVALASLTGGWGGATDAWGTGANLATNYDLISGFLPWTSTTGNVYFGNGSNQVFSGATSGTDYLRSCSGIGNLSGMSAAGTNQFGNDQCYQYGRANLFPMASGGWYNSAGAGVFFRSWGNSRSVGSEFAGFRSAAYVN